MCEHELDLTIELLKQWIENHYEHCGHPLDPWPHAGVCHWPMPSLVVSDYAWNPQALSDLIHEILTAPEDLPAGETDAG